GVDARSADAAQMPQGRLLLFALVFGEASGGAERGAQLFALVSVERRDREVVAERAPSPLLCESPSIEPGPERAPFQRGEPGDEEVRLLLAGNHLGWIEADQDRKSTRLNSSHVK